MAICLKTQLHFFASIPLPLQVSQAPELHIADLLSLAPSASTAGCYFMYKRKVYVSYGIEHSLHASIVFF